MKKFVSIMLASLLILVCFAGCSAAEPATDSAYVKKNGKLIVGITDYAPMDYKDENGEWTGFDAEFAQLFAKELGVKCEFFVIADWGKKVFELDSKNIDCIWNGMTINEELLKTTNCSDPYVINAQVVVMKNENLASYADAASIKGLTVAVESGSTGESAAKDAGIEKIVATQDQAKALMEVAAGTADACIIDITMANAMTGEGTDYAGLGYTLKLNTEEYGVGFRKDSDLTAKFNEFMKKLIADGTLPALAEKYGLTLAG